MPVFYGVFGEKDFHPLTGQNLHYNYVEVEAATREEGEAVMWSTFGDGWSLLQDEKPTPMPADPRVVEWWTKANVKFMDYPGGGPYVRIALPDRRPEPEGETVTMLVRLTEAMAKENALFIAERCIAHRPGPGCTTRHGAAVWFQSNTWPSAWDGARTFSIEGAGEVLEVRYVPRARAEEAAAADPENVSIAPDSASLGSLGVKPHPHMAAEPLSRFIPREVLSEPPKRGVPAVKRAAARAIKRVEEVKTWRDRILGVDVRDGVVVGVRMTSR